MHVKYFETYNDSDEYWFVSRESNLCHSDTETITFLMPISVSEARAINEGYGSERFRYYRDWASEYYTSGTCCVNVLPENENAQILIIDFFTRDVKNENLIDTEVKSESFEKIVEWMAANATDVWSITYESYGCGTCLFLKSETDYAAFKEAFPHVIDKKLRDNERVTLISDMHEALLQEKRNHLRYEKIVRNQMNEMKSEITALRKIITKLGNALT